MIEAPYVLSSQDFESWMKLNRAGRGIIQLLLHLASDRAHPHWGIRPLGPRTLAYLWPGSPACKPGSREDVHRRLRSALQEEFLAQINGREPDSVIGSVSPHAHTKSEAQKGTCSICTTFLDGARAQPLGPRSDLRMQLIHAVSSNDHEAAIQLLQPVARDVLADGVPRRFLFQVTKTFLLDPDGRNATRVGGLPSRLTSFLSGEPAPEQNEIKSSILRRRGDIKLPRTSGSIFYAPAIAGVKFQRDKDGYFCELSDVPASLSALETKGQVLREVSDVWQGYFRLALGSRQFTFSNKIEHVIGDEVKLLDFPALRHLWSGEDTVRKLRALLDARASLKLEGRMRLDAAVCWAGFGLAIQAEAPARASALLWLALESLYGGPGGVKDIGVQVYLKRLPLELGYEIARHVGRLKAHASKGLLALDPIWLSSVSHPKAECSIQDWLGKLRSVLEDPTIPPQDGLLWCIDLALNVFNSDKQASLVRRLRRDLDLLYAIRNGFVHSGQFEASELVAHYLAALSVEMLKATISELLSTWTRSVKGPEGVSKEPINLDDVLNSAARSP